MLDKAIEQIRKDPMFFNEYELKFVKDMVNRDTNDRPIWNPSLNQWNYLHSLTAGL